jgi:hypothetical protein
MGEAGSPVKRALCAGLAGLLALLLVGCDSVVSGKALVASNGTASDGADVARMDTGVYMIAAGRPFGAADGDVDMQATLEAHRLAPQVVGPWQLNKTMIQRHFLNDWTGPIPGVAWLKNSEILPAPMVDVAAAHGLFSGFNSLRSTDDDGGKTLLNVVFEFNDPGAASAAATEFAAQNLPPLGGPPGQPVADTLNPQFSVIRYDNPDGTQTASGVVAKGPFVFLAVGTTKAVTAGGGAVNLVTGILGLQQRAIDGFVPTDPAQRAALPKDPTGELLARTLTGPDNAVPFILGVWDPQAWLHFEEDPVTAAAAFQAAGVEVVSQRLTTVYRTHTADGAARLVDDFAKAMSATANVGPASDVPGLPTAKCFSRSVGAEPPSSPVSKRRVAWRYKCVGRADRFAYTAFSNELTDVHQQMAAQYRILIGR